MKSLKAGSIFVVLSVIVSLVFSLFPQAGVKATGNGIHLTEIGRYSTEGAEISAYDPISKRLFVTGAGASVEVLDLSDPANPTLFKTLDFDATSVTVKHGIVAITVPNADDPTQNGHVYLYRSFSSLDDPVIVEVGVLPDMVTFTPNGRNILVANEGERIDGVDPEGSVSIISLWFGLKKPHVKQVTFQRFNHLREYLLQKGVRIFPDAESVAQDIEPEYIAVSPDGRTAWVTLQENNSIAVINIPFGFVSRILPLGYKDHSLPGNGIDASDKDDAINIANWPVFGIYMPDGIAAFNLGQRTYLITANEGDARADEEERIKDLSLDPTAFPDADTLQEDENIGRLTVTNVNGDTDGDGDFDVLHPYGSRSFTVWSANGKMVFDSGDQLEQITASLTPDFFNANDGDPEEFDARSDNKGPEPEGVTTGVVHGMTYAFIGLERAGGGIMVYDMSNPANPSFVEYVRSDLDISPEGLNFISSNLSPNGKPLLVVTNEVSGTVTVYQIATTD